MISKFFIARILGAEFIYSNFEQTEINSIFFLFPKNQVLKIET